MRRSKKRRPKGGMMLLWFIREAILDSLKGVVKELFNGEKHRLDRKIKGIIKRNKREDNRVERNLQEW